MNAAAYRAAADDAMRKGKFARAKSFREQAEDMERRERERASGYTDKGQGYRGGSTSRDAAVSVGDRAKAQRARILAEYRKAGKDGLTPREVHAAAPFIDLNSCRSRTTELTIDGRLVKTSTRRDRQYVWVHADYVGAAS